MQLRTFLNSYEDKNEKVQIHSQDEFLFYGTIDKYFNDDNNIDGIIKSWLISVVNGEYVIIEIELK